jgi:hypothetical protein
MVAPDRFEERSHCNVKPCTKEFFEAKDWGAHALKEHLGLGVASVQHHRKRGRETDDGSPAPKRPCGSTPSGSTPSGSTPSGSTPSGSTPSGGLGGNAPRVGGKRTLMIQTPIGIEVDVSRITGVQVRTRGSYTDKIFGRGRDVCRV